MTLSKTTRRSPFAPVTLVALVALLGACGDAKPTPAARCVEVINADAPATPVAAPARDEGAQARIDGPKAEALAEPVDVAEPTRDLKVAKEAKALADPLPEPTQAHSDLEVVELVMAQGIKGREPLGVAKRFDAGRQTLTAWAKISNKEAPSQIEMIWRYEGKVHSRVALEVGTSPSWRTWSRKTIDADQVGMWTVDVVAPDGSLLERARFKIDEPSPVADLPLDLPVDLKLVPPARL